MADQRRADVRVDRPRSLVVGAMIGVALMAAVDTVVFHQVLRWHHFYDRSTPDVGLVSDGFLQAGYLVLLVAGFFLLADLRRRGSASRRSTWAGFFLGAGGFQLFDAIVDHKVLRVHQVRADVDDLLVYDVAWVASALVLLAVGAVLARQGRRRPRSSPRPAAPGQR